MKTGVWKGEGLERLKFLWIELAENKIREARPDTGENDFGRVGRYVIRYKQPFNQEESERFNKIIKIIEQACEYGYMLEAKDLC